MKTQSNHSHSFLSCRVHNLIILDESGSMQSIKQATIQGFNEIVQTIKGVERQFPEQEHFVTLVTFNSLGIKTKFFARKVKNLKEIDENTFQPDALTPLHDAIGISVNKLRQKIEKEKDCSVLVTILTDGAENDSKEYSHAAIKKLIEEMKGKGWTFTYIGANHEVEEVAFCLAITNTLQFEASEEDVKRAFDADKSARRSYALKMHRGENLQEDYFRYAGEEEQNPSDKIQ